MTNSCGCHILFDFYLLLYIYDNTKKEKVKLALNCLSRDVMKEERNKRKKTQLGHAHMIAVMLSWEEKNQSAN